MASLRVIAQSDFMPSNHSLRRAFEQTGYDTRMNL